MKDLHYFSFYGFSSLQKSRNAFRDLSYIVLILELIEKTKFL